MRNYAALVKNAREQGRFVNEGSTPLRMTPELFGKILVAAWAAKKGQSDFPQKELVIETLIAAAEEAPDDIKKVLSVEDRIGRETLANYSDYIAAAQMDGLVKRFNPDLVRVSVRLDRTNGANLLDKLTSGRENVRQWVDDCIEKLNNREKMRVTKAGENGVERGATA